MPLHCSISDAEQLVTLRTEGAVELRDLESFLVEMRTKSAIRYRKLMDLRKGHTVLTAQELEIYERKAIECTRYDQLGPYAIVVNRAAEEAHGALLSLLLSNSRRSSRLFPDPKDAHEWLRTQQIPPLAPEAASRHSLLDIDQPRTDLDPASAITALCRSQRFLLRHRLQLGTGDRRFEARP